MKGPSFINYKIVFWWDLSCNYYCPKMVYSVHFKIGGIKLFQWLRYWWSVLLNTMQMPYILFISRYMYIFVLSSTGNKKARWKNSYALEQQMEREFLSRKEGWTSSYRVLFHPTCKCAISLDPVSRPMLSWRWSGADKWRQNRLWFHESFQNNHDNYSNIPF